MGDFIGKKLKLCFKRDSVTNKHPNKTFALEPISCISPECVNPGRWPPFVSVRQISSSFGCRFRYRRYFMIFLVDMPTILGTKWYKYTNSITGSDMQILFCFLFEHRFPIVSERTRASQDGICARRNSSVDLEGYVPIGSDCSVVVSPINDIYFATIFLGYDSV